MVFLGGGWGEGERAVLDGDVLEVGDEADGRVGERMLEVGLKVVSMGFGLANISQSKGWLKSKRSSGPEDGASEIGDGSVKDVGLARGLQELSKPLKSIVLNAGDMLVSCCISGSEREIIPAGSTYAGHISDDMLSMGCEGWQRSVDQESSSH